MGERLSAAEFKLSAMDDRTFRGYTSGSTWNGWETPVFEHDVAVSILQASGVNGYRWKFDESQAAFVVNHIDDPQDYGPEIFPGVEFPVDDQIRILYPVGSHSWTWERQS